LHEFELQAFPKAKSDNPWVKSSPLHGHDAVRTQGRRGDRVNAPGSRKQRRRVSKPSELRPDLAWLDDLKMPDVPVHWDQRIIKYLEFYRYDQRGRNIMSAWLRSQGKYSAMMLKKLRAHKLPDALIYISMIESSYSPHEYSRVGASGLWQFMPAAGRIYGLHQGRWLDERNDPERSTSAVVFYFADLFDRFGDWDLAMAAFNAGYGAVIKSVAKYNTNDYWQLLQYENGLPWGTSNYVAKFLAAAIVGNNLETFGYDRLERSESLESDEVAVPKSVPFLMIRRPPRSTLKEIEQLNPQLRRNRTPPTISDYRVRVPKGKRGQFGQRFAQLRADWDDVDAYVVNHGERFEDVATKHSISRSKLRSLNGLTSESEVRGGMILVVPKVSAAVKATNEVAAKDDLYKSGVPRGDTGDALLVPVPDIELQVKGKVRHLYRVVSGDTQGGVAEAFHVDRHDLAMWNGLAPEAHLHARMVLQVWTSKSFLPAKESVAVLDLSRVQIVQAGSPDHLDRAEDRIGRKRLAYSPKRPESMETIGKKFGLGKYDLARINHRSPNTIIEPSESVLVYQVVDPSASDRAAEQAKAARKKAPKKKPTKKKGAKK
jgi:membrane-bound lytic murein transglycosylase D